jgi:hypothetical protein
MSRNRSSVVLIVAGSVMSLACLAATNYATTPANPAARVATPRNAPARPATQKSAPAAKQLTVTVLWDDAMSGKEAGVWMGYLFSRMKYVSNHGGKYPRVPGVVTPMYEEEVFARSEAALIYRDIRSRNSSMASPYFEDLVKVEAAGFIREYVWTYLKRPEWTAPSEPLRSAEFERWSRDKLAGHQVQTRGRVALTDSAS